MGWICISGATCDVSDGLWNNEGLAYFSISDSILNLHDAFFNYIIAILPGTYMLMIVFVIFLFVVNVLMNVRKQLNA